MDIRYVLINHIFFRTSALTLIIVTTDLPKQSKHTYAFRPCRSPRSKEQVDRSTDRDDPDEAGELCVALLRPNSTSLTKISRSATRFGDVFSSESHQNRDTHFNNR